MSEIVAHLRSLRQSCAQGMAWSSALVWAEKVTLLTGDTEDVLWLVDALAEEWLNHQQYARRIRDTAPGQYLASIVALRLGRAEDALDLLGKAAAELTTGLAGPGIGTRSTKFPGAQGETPTTSRSAKPVSSLTSSLYDSALLNTANEHPLNPRALVLYMQGAAVIQLSNVGGTEDLPSIKELATRHPDNTRSLSTMHRPASQPGGIGGAAGESVSPLSALVKRLWIEAVKADARCWEAWSGLREHGLLTCKEELSLIASLDWTSHCAGSEGVGQFFKQYCLATMTTYATNEQTVEATASLLKSYPCLVQDPSLLAIQASRLLSLGRARDCLTYTVRVLEIRRIPDPGTTAIHISALTALHARDALFRIAHELAEEFGISSIKRIDVEPADTANDLFAGGMAGIPGSSGSVMSTPRSTCSASNIRHSIGASASGVSRIRSGARGLLIPETPSRLMRRNGPVSSAATAAAWKGLWGLPTWTRPGPPVLATYPCALGPSHMTPSIGSPTQDEFIGASLAWFAIGCYYLVTASILTAPASAKPTGGSHIRPLVILTSAARLGISGSNSDGGTSLRRGQPLTPEAEHALSEARRWLTKTTLVSPRSVSAWVAFAHTFVLAGEWESATRALHSCVVHGGGRDSGSTAKSSHGTPSKHVAFRSARVLQLPERGSRAAHTTGKLGSVYLQMGDLTMAESCFDASMRCLSGFCIRDCLSLWMPVVDAIHDDQILAWCENTSHKQSESNRISHSASAMTDPQLLNDIGVLYYARSEFSTAKLLFAMALHALHINTNQQHMLQSAFAPSQKHTTRWSRAPDAQAAYSLPMANLGNALRRMDRLDAALLCLDASAKCMPSNPEITLSTAFTLHSRAISLLDQSDSVSASRDLDRSIDLYHDILSSRPGDPVTTDLLALALELSTNIQGTVLLGQHAQMDQHPRTPGELKYQGIVRPVLQQLPPSSNRASLEPEVDGSDEEMEIEEDTDSDMAVD
ncbi:hypothetical protein DL89DRAFT_272304 [Linderina pennispora]|uniref:TPR-like protein n=1 Tax=Linderina pennispora TaxID=61395 RepID=A0A1Y1VUQ2_9FUNG|nr:uncharacterized protein DL89DRAFT_272304 [Linderina pennispora]ORX64484.1 hypothetical protein DL89DRAFT_272304 [Linderina pennispora]